MERTVTVSPWHLGWTSGVGAGLWHGALGPLSGVSGPGLAQLRFIYTAPNRGATRQTTPRASTWRPWEAKTPFPARWRHGGVWDAPLCLHDVRLTLALRHALRDVTSGDTLNPVTEGLMRGETSMTWMTEILHRHACVCFMCGSNGFSREGGLEGDKPTKPSVRCGSEETRWVAVVSVAAWLL